MNRNKNKVFSENINMETQTVFMAGGNINIYPCDFERGQHIVADGNVAKQKGLMVTNSDGTSHFRAYRSGSGSRYTRLWGEPYGELKMSRTRLVMKISIPLNIDDPIGWMEHEAEMLKPNNTDGRVVDDIYYAISQIKKR